MTPEITSPTTDTKVLSADLLWKLASAPASVAITALYMWMVLVTLPQERIATEARFDALRKEFTVLIVDMEKEQSTALSFVQGRCYDTIKNNEQILLRLEAELRARGTIAEKSNRHAD